MNKKIDTCSVCKNEYPVIDMTEIFTGRKNWNCTDCLKRGRNNINERIDRTAVARKKAKER